MMGREIKRVALDFKWPEHRPYPGLINPHYVECPQCEYANEDECAYCGGEGIHPEFFADYNKWEPKEPPPGDGWQVWETVSDGSPISPIFAEVGELEEWLIANEKCTLKAAQIFIKKGWACSGVFDLRVGMVTGIQFYEFEGE